MNSVSNQLLKELVVQYQKTVDTDVFTKILLRVDRLVLRAVHQIRRQHRYLKSESINDLYQTGIIGVYKASLKFPAKENPDKVPGWIVAYVKSEILSSFPRPHCIHISQLGEIWSPEAEKVDPMHEHPDECLKIVFKRMMDEKVVTEEEVELLKLNRIMGYSLDSIGEMKGLCGDTIRSRIQGALARIQHRVRMLDLDPGDCILS